MKYISNSVDVISGLTITKDSNSPNDTIIVSPGACYDNTRTVVLSLTASMSKKNNNQLGNANYYVYIISDTSGNNPDILISASSTVPEGLSETTKYRKIGYFKTDSSAHISNIYSYGYNSDVAAGIANVIDAYRSGNNGYIVFSNGFKIQWGYITIANVSGGWNTDIYFLTPFSTSAYCVTDSAYYEETAGDKVNYYGCTARYTNYMRYRVMQERWSRSGYLWWMCVGY